MRRGFLPNILLIISLWHLTVAASGVAFLNYQIFYAINYGDVFNIADSIPVILLLLAITYIIGCGAAIVGSRIRRGLLFPLVFEIISWVLVSAFIVLYIFVLAILWEGDYSDFILINLAIVMGLGYFFIFTLQLATYNRSLSRFGIPFFVINLIHLFTLVFRYDFLFNITNIELFKYDIGFFIGMVLISIFLLRSQTFRRIQNITDLIFGVNTN